MVHYMMECVENVDNVDNVKEQTDVPPKEDEEDDELRNEKRDLKVGNQQIAANFASYLTYLYQHSLAANLLHNTSNSKNDNLNSGNFQQYLSKLLLLKNLANPLAHQSQILNSCPDVKNGDHNVDGEVLDLKYSPSPQSADTSSSCYSDSYPNYSTCSSPGPEDLRVIKSNSSSKSDSWLKNDNSSNPNFNCSKTKTTTTMTKLNNFKLDQSLCSTQDIARMIAAELRHYGIPQAVFSQRVLGRSQGTLSDLLRNPKPWNKLKAGKETFRRMLDWLNQSEEQRLTMLKYTPTGNPSSKSKSAKATHSHTSPPPTTMLPSSTTTNLALSMMMSSAAHQTTSTNETQPEEEQQLDLSMHSNHSSNKPSRKPRLVFTEIQRRTLMAIFKEVKRPSRDVQVTIAEQLNLKLSTVSNFFMNARRRSLDKFATPDSTNYEDNESVEKEASVVNNQPDDIINESPGNCSEVGVSNEDDKILNTPVDFSIKEEMD